MSGMTHMEEEWSVVENEGDGSTQITSTGGWFIGQVHKNLPGDNSGVKTAQEIVDAHNKSLSRKPESVVDSAMVAACSQKEVK